MGWPDPIALRHRAEELVSTFDDDLIDQLRQDPAAGVAALGITVVETVTSGSSCDLDASYNRRTNVISVSELASPSRRRFSLLHELGHERINKSAVGGGVADWLDGFDRNADAVEERVCDAFAAHIIFSGVDVALPTNFGARAVIDLWEADTASREACCVFAAQHLGAPGMVVLARDGEVLFSSPHSLQFRIGRGVEQDERSAITRAGNEGLARAHRERPTLRSGPSYTDLDGDARLTDDGYVFAVLREARQRTDRHGIPERSTWTCLTCDDDITDEDWCNTCRQRICPECGCRCAGPWPEPKAERRCGACGMAAAAAVSECELCGAELG